ncbi:hypothetical protein scyTo_0016514, partial [Scyliorhinus torazame]|nr:hypothetical protein [Scyliorhinus torazame]
PKLQLQGSFDQEAEEHGTDNIAGKWSGSDSDMREPGALELQMDGTGTSGVCTLSRSVSHDSQQNTCPLILQLGRLRAETNRLLEDLTEKEREFQQLLLQTLQQKNHDIESLRKRSKSTEVFSDALCEFHTTPVDSKAEELTQWLSTTQVDQQTIDKIVSNGYTLHDLLIDVTRDDLKYVQIRGGMMCRLWAAISAHRKLEGEK